MMEELLLNYLKAACRGREFCASSTELGRAIGVGRKAIQKLVSRLRRKKKPICSTNSGYFYAKTAQDIASYSWNWSQRAWMSYNP